MVQYGLRWIKKICLSLQYVTEVCRLMKILYVFGCVVRFLQCVGRKHFPFRFNLKCEPELAIELREKYENIIPGYHCNRKNIGIQLRQMTKSLYLS